MERTNYKHALLVTVFLMALALIGMPFVEFVFVVAVTMFVGFVGFYAVSYLFHLADKVLHFLYAPR